MKKNVKLIGIFVFGMLVLASASVQVTVVAAETTQTWFLSSVGKPSGAPTANDGLTHAKDNLMQKDSRTGTGSYFTLPYDKVAWFYADTGAECGLGFGEYSWRAHIRTGEKVDGDEVGSNLTVEICRLEKDTGNVTVLASHTETLTAQEIHYDWNISCTDNGTTTQDFSTGDWLAVRLSWDCTDGLRVDYKAEAGLDSFIESPSTDPGYPVPELHSLVLFSTGLLALAGYSLLTKRRGIKDGEVKLGAYRF